MGELLLEVPCQAGRDVLGRLRGDDADGQRGVGEAADGHCRLGLGDLDPVHGQVGVAPALHQRERECFFVLDLRVAREERGRDVRVGLEFAVREGVDAVVEVGDGHLGPRGPDQRGEEDGEVFQGFVLDGFAVHAGVQVGPVGGDGDGRVDDAAHPERQARDVVVEPVAVGEEDEVDRTDGRVHGLHRVAEPAGPGFFVALEEKGHVARERFLLDEVGDRVDGCQDRAFVVGHAAAVEVPVERLQTERVAVPAWVGVAVGGVDFGVDHVVVAVEEDRFGRRRGLGRGELGEEDGVDAFLWRYEVGGRAEGVALFPEECDGIVTVTHTGGIRGDSAEADEFAESVDQLICLWC